MTAKRFLISPAGDSILDPGTKLVIAPDQASAIEAYLLQVFVHEALFRDFVLDDSANGSFAERFFFQTELEKKRFLKDGTIGTEDEIVYSRVRSYFADRPDLGAWFVNFLETGNADGVSEDLFTYIALRDGQEHLQLSVVDVEDIPVISAGTI